MKIDESTNFNALKNSLYMLTIKNTIKVPNKHMQPIINKHKLKKI